MNHRLAYAHLPREATHGSNRMWVISSVSFLSLVTVFCFVCNSVPEQLL